MGTVRAPTDAELARRAGRLRVLRLEELFAAGLTRKALRHRLEQGRLQRLWPSVYLVGPAPPHPLSLAHGATLSFTAAAYVSSEWACFVRGFAPAPDLPVDVLVVGGSRFRRENIRTHRSTTLAPADLGTQNGIRVTSAARAILDSADHLTLAQTEALIAQAHAARAVSNAQLEDVLGRAGRRKAAARLRAVLTDTSGGLTLSEAERILRRLLRQAGLAQPVTNFPIGRYRADFAWPKHRLIVELDSWTHHGHRKAFNPDRERTAWLTAKRWSVLPVTADQLRDEPFKVVAVISEALAVRAA